MTYSPQNQALRKMETDIFDIERWGTLLVALASSKEPVHADAILVVGYALSRLGDELEAAWHEGVAQTGGKP